MAQLDIIGQYWTVLDSIGQYWTVLDSIGHGAMQIPNVSTFWFVQGRGCKESMTIWVLSDV